MYLYATQENRDKKGHETRCYYDCPPSMHRAFDSLTVAEIWKKMNSLIYLENNTMPTILPFLSPAL